jgi:hypothetical protein
MADEELFLHMHIVDADQCEALVRIIEQGVKERAAQPEELTRRDFYFAHLYRSDGG